MSEIDNLEIRIEASAKSANNTLDEMSKKIDSVAEALKKVLPLSDGLKNIGKIDSNEIKNVKKQIDSIEKSTKKPSKKQVKAKVDDKEIKRATESLDDLFDRFSKVGTGLDVSKLGFQDLIKESKKADLEVQRLNDRLEKKISVEGTDNLGKAWVNLVYDIQKATNQAEVYREAISKIKSSVPNFKISRGDEKKEESVRDTNNGKSVELGKYEEPDVLGLEKYIEEAGEATNKTATFENQILELKRQLSSLSAKGLGQYDKEYDDVARELAEVKKAKKEYDNEMKKSVDPPESLSTYESKIKNLRQELKRLGEQGFGQGDEKYDKLSRELAILTERQKSYNRENRKVAKNVIENEQISNIKKFSSVLKKTGDTMKKILPTIKKIAHGFSSLVKAVKAPIAALSKLKNSIMGVQKQANKGMTLGKMIGSSIAFSTVFQAISLIKQAITEGSNNLAQYSGEYNNSISSMVSSLLYLKNAWAAAFAPIINVVAPYVSKLVDIISIALNKVAQFMAVLTGKAIVVQAKKTWKDYGSSLQKVGSGASDASKGLDKAAKAAEKFQTYTLGIDELNVQPQTNTSYAVGAGGSGGGGGTGGAGEILPSEMFETIEPSGAISDFAKRIREAFLNEDWEDLGKIIADGFNTGLKYLYDVINWDNVGPHITKFITAFSETFNSFANHFDWDLLGRTIGTGINTIINTLNLLIESIDWITLGGKISAGINGLFDEIEWEDLGTLFGNQFMIFWETAYGIVAKLKWGDIGKDIADGLNGMFSKINIGMIGSTLGKVLTGISESAIDFAKTFDWTELGENISNGVNNFFAEFDGEKLAEGATTFISGLLNTIKTTVSEIDWSEIWRDIIDFLINVDWAGLLADLAVAALELVDGIRMGLIEAIAKTDWKKVWNNIVGSLKSAFGKIGEWFSEKFGEAVELIKAAFEPIVNWFSQKWNGIVEVFSPVIDFFGGIFSGAWEKIKNAWAFVGTWFSQKWTDIKNAFKNVKQWFKDVFKGAYDGVTRIWSGIKSFFGKVANWIINPIQKAVNGVIDGINWVFDKVGAKKPLKNWTNYPKFASGSNGLPSDTIGVVNDQAGSTYKELIVPPHGKPFIPDGRNVMLPMEKGTKIMPAGQTKELMDGIPKFKNGIGSFFGNAWEKITNFTGDILDYAEHPSKILQIAIDKFTDLSGVSKFFVPLATGAVNKVFDSAVSYIEKLFDSVGGKGINGAIKWAIGIANDNKHGYDQARRTGPDYDCSSFVTTALKKAGFNIGLGTTSSMYGQLMTAGFKNVANSVNLSSGKGLKKGDVLLRPGAHTAMYVGDGKIVHASINELGRVTGGKTGDQTGKEIATRSYYNYPWTYVFRYAKGFKNGIGRIGISDLIPQYSVGGFPEDGLFMANRGELVGQFSNGQTAVANNYQIVGGIKDGVKEAVSEILAPYLSDIAQNTRETADKDLTVRIQDRDIVTSYERGKRRSGYSFT